MRSSIFALLLAAAAPAFASETPKVAIIICAPGSPGTTAEAQPTLDLFAAAVARAAQVPVESVSATYFNSEKEGLAHLSAADASVALVSMPFLLKHGAALKLSPRLQVEMKDGGAGETWSLVAKKGRVTGPSSLATFTVYSVAGFAPDFVRGALGAWGKIPEGAKVVESSQVLSTLRKAASGADVAVLLDGTQSAALASLPFAADLEVVARSEKLPAGFVVSVADRMPAAIEKGFFKLAADPQGAAALATIRMARFVAVDQAGLKTARSLVLAQAK